MRYRKLVIDNFLCFRHFEMEFAPGVSIIIGPNGSGKTSLARALVYSLYFMFTSDRSMGSDFLAAGNPDLKMRSIEIDEFSRNNSSDEAAADANFHGEMDYGNELITWDMYRRSTGGSALYPSRYKHAYQQFMRLYRAGNNLPLIAFFSDSFPHTLTNLSQFAKQQIAASSNTLRNFGYYRWDNETACIGIWQQRLINSLARLKQLEDDIDEFTRNEVNFVTGKLKEFSQVVNTNSATNNAFVIDRIFYQFDGDQKPELWLHFTSGKEIKYDRLPAGYKRLYSIVLDLSYRAFLLNRNSDAELTGLAIIDEIDLHLHPSLENEVVQRFTRTFPELQFIMTTHSPLVISNLVPNGDRNRVFRLVAGKDAPVAADDFFGADYNDVLIDYMDSYPRNETLDFLKVAYLRAVQMDNKVLIDKRKNELTRLLLDDEVKANEMIAKWQQQAK